jgi:hypothetical protein
LLIPLGRGYMGRAEAAEEFAGIYSEEYGGGSRRRWKEFFTLAALSSGRAFVEMGGRRLCAPEFFANPDYMLARAETEKRKGRRAEALFLLRTVSSLAALALRTSPLDGRMLALRKFYDSAENVAQREFAVDGKVMELAGKKGDAGRAQFGQVAMSLHSSGFFKAKAADVPAFWGKLGSKGAALFSASYADGARLSLLDEDTQVERGSDIYKLEQAGQRLVVRRAMALESGKAKEIKQHIARMIGTAEMKSLDEAERAEDFGVWGEAVYAISRGEGGTLLAHERARRFY